MNVLSFDTNDNLSLPNKEPVFGGGLRQSFEDLLTTGEVRQLEAGAVVVVEGQQDTELFILLEGHAEVMAPLQNDWVSVAVLGPGNVIGEMAFVDNLPRSARVISTTPVSLLVITRERFLEFAGQRPMQALNFIMELSRTLAYRLRRLQRFDAAEKAREEERKLLAAELHDQTLGDLGRLAVELGFLAHQASTLPEDVRSALDRVRELLKDTDRGLRDIVRGIYPQVLVKLGLVVAIDSHLTELTLRPISNPYPLSIELRVTGFDADRLPEKFEIEAFRFVQQAVSNVVQHAHAKKLNVELTWSAAELTLSVADDGVGFDVENPGVTPATSHFGLSGMRDRVEQSLGTFEITSEAGKGTTLRARIPVTPNGSGSGDVRVSTYVFDLVSSAP